MRAPRAWGVFRPLQLGPWFTLSSLWEMFVVYVISGRKKKKGERAREKGGKDGREEKEKPCSLATVGESAQSVGCL